MDLRLKSETATTITLEWDAVPGVTAYRFNSEKQAKATNSNDQNRTEVKFAKGSAWYTVEALTLKETGEYPQPEAPLSDFAGVCTLTAADHDNVGALGIKHARLDNPYTNQINQARANGVEVLPTAAYCPWTDLNGGKDWKWPPLPQHYAEWSKRVVDKFRSVSPRPIAVEAWNEPWLPNFWRPSPEPAKYLALTKALAAEVWSVWPETPILVCGDVVSLDEVRYPWLANLLAADTTDFLTDSRIRPTVHNYCEMRSPDDTTPEPCWWNFDRYTCVYDGFKAHGHPDPKVWATEFGWRTGNVPKAVPEATQAAYIVDGYEKMLASGKVERAYSFVYKTNDTEWAYNWLRPDNSEKPVCQAVRDLIS